MFSGIGGFALASKWVGGIRTIGFCENEKYAQKVLKNNFKEITIFDDVRKLHPDVIIPRDGRIDFITAGFPCQVLSVAGNQAGIEADRSGLFFEIMRLSDEIYAYCGIRPALVLENVSNILAGNGGSWARAVYGELAVRGYYCEWKIVSASDVGAPHQRKRWWCIAYMADANNQGIWSRLRGSDSGDEKERGKRDSYRRRSTADDELHVAATKDGEVELADSDSRRCKESESKSKPVQWTDFRDEKNGRVRASECGLGGMVDGIPNWLDEPGDLPRVTNGQKNRVARLKGLGNAVVPQCAMIPLMRIKEILLSGQ